MSHQDVAPLPEGYQVELLEGHETLGPDDVLAFWLEQDAVPADEARRRIHEVLFVGVGPAGELTAVCTSFLYRSRQLRMSFWNLRVFVAADYRKEHLSRRLVMAGSDHLRAQYQSGQNRRAAGTMIVVQHLGMRNHSVSATLKSDFTFVGQTAEGFHMRVHYFPGAEAPLPPVPPV